MKKLLTTLILLSIGTIYAQKEAMSGKRYIEPQAKGYLKAHSSVKSPLELLGGPISIEIEQKSGGVFVALPDFRKLDSYIFGTPEHPSAFEGTPGISGVPIMARNVKDGKYTTFKKPSPFGDKYIVMKKGILKIKAKDVTATDAATTEDKIELYASWVDKEGNKYEVRANMPVSKGLESPTFGGVVTNHILHGFTRLGTPLMPTEFVYFAFWAVGDLYKNGKIIAKKRMVHGMLTEYVRKEEYKLAFDSEITPTKLQFHLIMPPFKPDMEKGKFVSSPLSTDFKLPNGMELPFWHVMFENIEIEASRE